MAFDVRCKEAGAHCSVRVRADDEEEFKEKLLAHLEKKHAVKVPNATVVDYLVGLAKDKK